MAWGLFIVSFLWLSKVLLIGNYPDFSIYYDAAKFYLSGGNPYLGSISLFSPFIYPPIVLIFFVPFTFLSPHSAGTIWVGINILSLLYSIYLLSRIFEIHPFSRLGLLLFSLVFISFPVKYSLGMGQINMIILLLLTLVLYFLEKRKESLAGIFLGITIILKFFPIIFPAYLLFNITKDTKRVYKNRYTWSTFFDISFAHIKIWLKPKQVHSTVRLVKGFLTAILIGMIFVAIFIPFDMTVYFLTSTLPGLFTSWKTDYYNQALSGFIGRSFGTDILANFLKVTLSSIITLISLIIIVKNEHEDLLSIALKFGTIITASLLINTFSWQHHFVWLIIPFYASIFYLRSSTALSNNKKNIFYLLLFVSYILVSINFKDPYIFPRIFQSHVLYGTLILLGLDLYLLVDRKKE